MTYYCFDVFNPLFLSLWSSQCTAPFGESKKWVSPKDTTHSFAGRTAHAGCAISSLHLEAGPFSFEFLQNTPLCTPPPQCPFGPELFLKLCTCLFSLTKTGLGGSPGGRGLVGILCAFSTANKVLGPDLSSSPPPCSVWPLVQGPSSGSFSSDLTASLLSRVMVSAVTISTEGV